MPARPESDRNLDAAIALAAVREALPSLDCRRASHLGSGWASDVYVLDERFVARFPRNAELARWVASDQAILGLVASSLVSEFRVPAVVGRGRAGAHFPYDFLVCEFVPGVGADHAISSSEPLAADLGRALTSIHSVSVNDATNAGVRRGDDNTGPLCFLHGDFRADNIIVDPASGRLVGVIDWGNAAIGDPAMDFVTLVLWRGWKFMHAALDAYRLPVRDDFIHRVRVCAQLESLQWLTDSVKRGLDTERHLTSLRNAFSLESL
ncbi:MAG: phosphotransferase family protein [Gemmatimonadales bacterium]